MILKIQKPLFTSGMDPEVLLYDKDRSVLLQLPYDDTWSDIFGGDDKQYWECSLREDPEGIHFFDGLTLIRQVGYQPW